MQRSFTARLPIGRIVLPAPRRLPRAPGLGHARAALAALWGRRATRIALLAVLLSPPLLGGGFLALRHSSFVAVEHVRISGVHGAEAPAIAAALGAAARHMSTLDVHSAALRAAVAQFRVVREVSASAQFPHGLTIAVVEQPPVAALVAGGVRTAVAADGVVLGPALLSSSLPTLGGWVAPAPGAHLHDRGLLAALRVLGAAPRALATRIERTYTGAQGLTVAMRNGLVVYFGDDTLPHAKWLSLARVLADPSSAGAIYIDVRLPGRPAAGFPAGAAPRSQSSGSESTAGSESTVGALAEGLPAPTTSATSATEPAAAARSEGSPSSAGESAQAGAGEAGGASSEAGESSSTSSTPGAAEAPAAGG
jgi:cell division protein FtsQ